jgi:TRAP-type mannitol/chloroaromatic compound transport system permease large subunit
MITAQMAYITPPFGYTLFYMKGVLPSGVSMGEVYRGIVPFFMLQVLCLAILMLWPSLITWLPSKMASG